MLSPIGLPPKFVSGLEFTVSPGILMLNVSAKPGSSGAFLSGLIDYRPGVVYVYSKGVFEEGLSGLSAMLVVNNPKLVR